MLAAIARFDVFNDNITHIVDSVKRGLVGSLNDSEVDPTLETIGNVSTGEYTVLEKKTYTQNLIIMPERYLLIVVIEL